MRISTLEYSANTPITKQITAPTNSIYAVGVKVTKDGQVVDGNLSVDGLSATTKIGDYSIVKLSSDGVEGMKRLNIAVDKSATFQGEISAENELSNTVPSSRQLALEIPLSAYFDAPLTITPHDINVEMFQFRTAGLSDDYGQFEDIATLQAEKDRVISFRNVGGDVSNNQLYCYQNTNGYSQDYPSYCWHYFKTGVGNVSEFGQRTLPLSATIYFGQKIVSKKTKAQIKGAVSIDTHDGLKANFPLQVVQKDIGYFELPDDEGGDEGGGGDEGVSYSYSVEGYETFINNEVQEEFWWFGANQLSASDGSTLPETLTLDARKISGSFVATGTDGYSLSGTLPQEVEEGMCFPMVISYEGVRYIVFNNNGEYTWISMSDETGETTIVGPTITISTKEEDYAEIDGCFIYYPDGIPTEQINISLNANISFGT